MPKTDGVRLVLDIGGGSTELILGQGDKPSALESLHMGCVVVTETYFPNGVITAANFDRARVAARLKLRPVKAYFRDSPDIEAVGTSGTIRATEAVARELGIIESNDMTPAAVDALIQRVLEFDNVNDISLPGLSERRAQVWPGGLAILVELMHGLRIDTLRVSDGALREGLLYESLGRIQHEDARERSVKAIGKRYHVDQTQAERVATTAADLLSLCSEDWNLESSLASQTLDWAARLHEIGLDIAHDAFQKHGAYIVENADLPGFPRNEQAILAFMILNQRSGINQAAEKKLPRSWRQPALRLTVLLRLAVLMNRSRSKVPLPQARLKVDGGEIQFALPKDWLLKNPLTVADLEREARYLGNAGFDLTISDF